MLALMETGGKSGKVFWDEKEYPMFNQENEILKKKRAIRPFFYLYAYLGAEFG